MRWYWLVLIYVVAAIVIYAAVYYLFLVPAPAAGGTCTPSFYQRCP